MVLRYQRLGSALSTSLGPPRQLSDVVRSSGLRRFLAMAGYCLLCLRDERKPASVRMYQFEERWLPGLVTSKPTYIRELENATRPLNCPCLHSHCLKSLTSVLSLQFLLQDAFEVERSDNTKNMKRLRYGVDETRRGRKCRSEENDRMTAFQNPTYLP